MAYAFVRENNVEFVESREPISQFYPAGILPFFVVIPESIRNEVCPGWICENGVFTEPEIMSDIPTVGGVYIPNDKAKTAAYIETTINELETQITAFDLENIELGQMATEAELQALKRGKEAK